MEIKSLYNKEILEGKYFPNVKAYYYKQLRNFNMELHSHDTIEIMYVVSGECVVEVLDDKVDMKKGDFIYIDGNIPHQLVVGNNSKCRMLNVEFVFSNKNSIMPSIGQVINTTDSLKEFINGKNSYCCFKDYDDIYGLLKNLVVELDRNREQHIIESLIYNIMIYISRYYSSSKSNELKGGTLYVNKAINYIEHNYDRDINADKIAQKVGIHQGYLHKIFKEYTGTTLIEYITNIRVNKSKMILANTDIPIIDVCNYVGINSRQYFTYVFKRQTGITPLEYRKNSVINKCLGEY